MDIIHGMNEKLSVQTENLRQGDQELNKRLITAERKLIDLEGSSKNGADQAQVQQLREVISILQANDEQ